MINATVLHSSKNEYVAATEHPAVIGAFFKKKKLGLIIGGHLLNLK